MKAISLLIISLCLSGMLLGQVSKTIHITAGTLATVLTAEETGTITSLTITGTLNDWDIETIQNGFPLLKELDVSGCSLVSVQMDGYTSKDNWWPGPSTGRNSANWGGLHKPSLTAIQLPSTLEVIGYRGFDGCSGLTQITIPSTVIYIGESAFESCSSLTSVTFLPSEITIYSWAFAGCNALTEVFWPSGMTTISRLAFSNSLGFTNLVIPEGIKIIEYSAFIGCSSIQTLSLPASVEYVGNNAFGVCPNISSVYSYNPVPPEMYNAFATSVYANATLYVPFGSKALYAAPDGPIDGWIQFAHIEEIPPFTLSATRLTMAALSSQATVALSAEQSWSLSCDQSWLTVSPTSGSGDQLLGLTAGENTLSSSRTALVTVTCAQGYSNQVTVIQEASSQNVQTTTLNYKVPKNTEYYTQATLSAILRNSLSGAGIANKPIRFALGLQTLSALTDSKGRAEVTFLADQVPGNYPVVIAFSGDGSYQLCSVNDSFTILPRTVMASLTGTVTKVYDGTKEATLTPDNYTLTGIVNNDEVSLNNPTAGTYNNKNEGTGKKVTVSGLALMGAHANKYALYRTSVSENIGSITAPGTMAALESGSKTVGSVHINAWPNPFTERLTIAFNSAADTHARLEILDVTGTSLAILIDQPVRAGQMYQAVYRPEWKAGKMLIYRLTMGGQTLTGKVMRQAR